MKKIPAVFMLAVALSCGCARVPVVAVKPGFDLGKVGRVALLDFADGPGGAGTGQIASQAMEPYLLAAGYSLVERGQVHRILQEQAFDQSAAVAPDAIQKLGRLLSVQALVLGSVTGFTAEQTQVYMQNVSNVAYNPVYDTVQVTGRKGEVRTQRVLGHYDVTTTEEQIPATYQTPATVAFSAKLVDAATGVLLWTGSTSGAGDTAAAAADDAAKRLMESLKKAAKPKP
ncbi:MAG: hypothetical protein NTY77_16370 [Elusimicrobia bacterium]|nr:hypothetical protein [Elusimicrobiota bacterium]